MNKKKNNHQEAYIIIGVIVIVLLGVLFISTRHSQPSYENDGVYLPSKEQVKEAEVQVHESPDTTPILIEPDQSDTERLFHIVFSSLPLLLFFTVTIRIITAIRDRHDN